MNAVEEIANGFDCFGKGCGLSGNGDEQMRSGWVDMIRYGMVQALQAFDKIGSLIQQNVVTRRDEECWRQCPQSFIAT